MGTKRKAQLTTLKLEIASVYTTVFSVRKIDGPDGEQLFEDLTDLDSTFIEDGEPLDLSTPGSVKIEGFHDVADATHVAILAQVKTPGAKNWKITYPNGAITAFVGTAKNFVRTSETKKFVNYACEIKLKSPATETAAP